MLQKLKSKTVTTPAAGFLFCAFLVVFSMSNCSSPNHIPEDNNLYNASQYFWRERDSVKYYYNKIDTTQLSIDDKYYYYLVKQYLRLVKNDRNSLQNLEKTKEYFVENRDYLAAGEISYLVADYHYHSKNRDEMIANMKQAEYYLSLTKDSVPDMIYGVMYIQIAYTFYLDHMNDMAYEYALKALPYHKKSNITLNLAMTYNLLTSVAPTPDSTSEALRDEYYKEALFYTKQLHDSTMLFDVQYTYEELTTNRDSVKLQIAKKSCTGTKLKSYAYFVANHYLEHMQLDSAAKYIEIYSGDTIKHPDSKNKYKALLSQLLYLKKSYKESAELLWEIYVETIENYENTEFANTYSIVRQYDEILEKEEKLRQMEKQQKMKLGLAVAAVTILALALVVTILSLLYHRKKQKHLLELQQKQAEQERLKVQHQLDLQQEQAEKDLLQAQLDAAHEMLKDKLRQRLDITKRFQLDKFKGMTTEELPEWVRQLIDMTTFTNEKQWLIFRDEYNEATHGELDNLKKQYPALTEADLQYIALSTLGLTVEEMCILTGSTNRTIWNRKQTVKGKMERVKNEE